MSLVSRHLARHAAGRVAAAAAKAAPSATQESLDPDYAALLEVLGADLHTLHNIQSIERKIDAKRGMIDRYKDWVDGALRAGADGKAAQDDIVAAMLIWSLDIQDWTYALQIGAHVLAHGVSLERFVKRTAGTVIAEEVADASIKDIDAVDHGTLVATDILTAEQDMPDEVRAKLMRAIGCKLAAEADAFDPESDNAPAGGKPAIMEAALTALRRAVTLDDKVGVKKDIEKLERELKKLAPPT